MFLIMKHKKLEIYADPGGRAVYGFGLLSLACWDGAFESLRRHG